MGEGRHTAIVTTHPPAEAHAPRSVRSRLSRLCGERRVSLRRVARETGLAYRSLGELYRDRSTRLDLRTITALCDYFRVDPSHLLEWTPPPAGVPAAPPP